MANGKITTIKISEKEVMHSIKEYLELKKVLFIRNNTGAAVVEKRFFRFGSPGSPDFFVWKNGKCYGIEAKGSSGRVSDAQKDFQTRFEKEGGVYILAYSVTDVMRQL